MQINKNAIVRWMSVRRAAILALAKLDSANATAYLLAGLRDASPVVHKGSSRQIIRAKAAVRMEDLLPLLREGVIHQCKAALLLAPETGKWEWLILLLEAALLPPEQISRHEIAEELAHWNHVFNHSQSQPSLQQIIRIRQTLERCGPKLHHRQRALIEFSLPNLPC